MRDNANSRHCRAPRVVKHQAKPQVGEIRPRRGEGSVARRNRKRGEQGELQWLVGWECGETTCHVGIPRRISLETMENDRESWTLDVGQRRFLLLDAF